jgi:hypothetical protein
MTTPDTGATDLWPFNRNTNILDSDLARSIRAWALSDGGMTETELRSYSQRQCLRLYLDRCIKPTLQRLLKPQRPPEESEAGADRVLLSQSPPADGTERMLWEALHAE